MRDCCHGTACYVLVVAPCLGMEGGEKGCYLHVNLRCFYSNCQSDQLCDSETTTVAFYSVSSHLSLTHTQTHTRVYCTYTSKNRLSSLCLLPSPYSQVHLWMSLQTCLRASPWHHSTVVLCYELFLSFAICSSGNTLSEFWECIHPF